MPHLYCMRDNVIVAKIILVKQDKTLPQEGMNIAK